MSEQKIRRAKLKELELFVFQTVEKYYTQTVDYRKHRFANRSPKYKDTVRGYITKLVNKVKFQMKAHLFELIEPISIIAFLASFKLACDTNIIHQRQPCRFSLTMLRKHSQMHWTVACVRDRLPPFATSARIEEPNSHKIKRSYPDVVRYLFKKYATDQAIAEIDVVILR